jgi:hypothetical protein
MNRDGYQTSEQKQRQPHFYAACLDPLYRQKLRPIKVKFFNCLSEIPILRRRNLVGDDAVIDRIRFVRGYRSGIRAGP